VLRAYVDESFSKDQRVLALGGWLATDDIWDEIEKAWKLRIDYENRVSTKKGFNTISRYHAADMSSLINEFDRTNGWDNERQKRFCKKLIEILTRKRKQPVMGFSMAVVLDNWKLLFRRRVDAEKNVYRFLMMRCANLIGIAMHNQWPNEQVVIFHDHGRFNSAAQLAFTALKAPDCQYRDYFKTVAPLCWKDCIALQPADLLAYEGQKTAHAGVNSPGDFAPRYRKALQAMLGGNAALQGDCFLNYFENIRKARLQELNRGAVAGPSS
jgi:hypothetical protein